jgi:hypothetical protein
MANWSKSETQYGGGINKSEIGIPFLHFRVLRKQWSARLWCPRSICGPNSILSHLEAIFITCIFNVLWHWLLKQRCDIVRWSQKVVLQILVIYQDHNLSQRTSTWPIVKFVWCICSSIFFALLVSYM